VHAQDGGRLAGDRLRVVARVRAVRRADLHEPCPALPQHVGNAEPAADLDRLPPRDDDLARLPEHLQGHEQARGVVVHDQPVLRPRRAPDEVAHVLVAAAAAALVEVVLQVRVPPRGLLHRGDGSLAQWSAPQVRLEDDAGRVDDPAQAWRTCGQDRGARPPHDLVEGGDGRSAAHIGPD
jgi:hypothetical protein